MFIMAKNSKFGEKYGCCKKDDVLDIHGLVDLWISSVAAIHNWQYGSWT